MDKQDGVHIYFMAKDILNQKDFIKILRDVVYTIIEKSENGSTTVKSIIDGAIMTFGMSDDYLKIENDEGTNQDVLEKRIYSALGYLKRINLVTYAGRKISNDKEVSLLPVSLTTTSIEIETAPRFEDLLCKHGLFYDVETIENFLLSLKVKPFLIFVGGSGTGKTKLAQVYGKWISSQKYQKRDVNVTLGASDDSGGWTFEHDALFELIPELKNYPDRCIGSLEDLSGTFSFDLEARTFFGKKFNKQAKDFSKKIFLLKHRGDEKAVLTLSFPISGEGKNYEIVPVGSDWDSSRFISGYYNAITKSYVVPTALKLMLSANENPLKDYLLVLDEMNLSHVERYFSDILSAMESKENIVLHKENLAKVPKEMSYPENLSIVGTVNMDETTYMFSPKVLDRANVIEFEPQKFSDIAFSKGPEYNFNGDTKFLMNPRCGTIVRTMTASDIVKKLDNSKIIIEVLTSIQNAMKEYGLEFGFRTVTEILRFMYVAFEYENKTDKNWKRYLDAQVIQKILPKIHGNTSIKPLID